MTDTEGTTPAPSCATPKFQPPALVAYDVQRLVVTDDTDRTTGIYEEDPMALVQHIRGQLLGRQRDGKVLVTLIPDEGVDEVRFDREPGTSVLETLIQAREAIDVAIRAHERLSLQGH